MNKQKMKSKAGAEKKQYTSFIDLAEEQCVNFNTTMPIDV